VRHCLFILLLLCCCSALAADFVITATVTITNASNITGTNAESITVNTDTRTWTNSLHNPATQILKGTNIAQDAQALLIQTANYPFANVRAGGDAISVVTFRGSNNVTMTVTISPTNWGYSILTTQTLGSATVVRVPYTVESPPTQTNNASGVAIMVNAPANTNGIAGNKFNSLVDVPYGLGLHGRALVTTNYTLTTNDLYVGVDTRSNTNLILTLPTAASATNLVFVIKDEGGAAATNIIRIYPQSGERIDGLTNLNVAANYGGVIFRSRGSTNYAIVSTGAGVSGSISGGGSGIGATELGFVTLTNGAATVASTNVATNSLIFLTRYASDGTVLPINEVAPRILGTSFALASSDTNDAVVSYQLINSGSASPIPTVGTNYLNPTAYIRFDETNAMDVAVDVIGGQNFTNSAGVVSSVSGIITNAYQLEKPNGDDFLADVSASSYDFGTNDFAIRMWLRPHSTNANDGLFLYDGGSPTSWYGRFTNSLSGATNRVSWQAVDPSAVTTSLNSTNDLAGDTWHRVILWHKQGIELGLKVDNQPSETMTFTNIMASTGVPLELYITGTGNRIDYDEMAVWNGYVPTEGEWTYDWNGGLGRTWPLH
jgi:hypothetical protein